jgi:hypothetical protein
MKEKARGFKWSELEEEYFDTLIYENIEMLNYKYHGKYCHTINDKLDLTNCKKKYIFLDYNQNRIYFRCEITDGDSYISRSTVGMSSYQQIKVHWISQLLQTSIIRYLVWYYKIKKTSKVQKEYEDKSRQTSIYEYMVPIQRNSYNQYDRLWCKGLDIFSQKDYLTNEQEEIEALKDIEIGDDGDGWRFDEMCYWHFNTDNLWNEHDLDCPREDIHDGWYDNADEEYYAIRNQRNQHKNKKLNMGLNEDMEVESATQEKRKHVTKEPVKLSKKKQQKVARKQKLMNQNRNIKIGKKNNIP